LHIPTAVNFSAYFFRVGGIGRAHCVNVLQYLPDIYSYFLQLGRKVLQFAVVCADYVPLCCHFTHIFLHIVHVKTSAFFLESAVFRLRSHGIAIFLVRFCFSIITYPRFFCIEKVSLLLFVYPCMAFETDRQGNSITALIFSLQSE